ncbi:C2 domain containing protein [Nitzschia inconspicua]|uniref:C2 domain containing protein n=1 Tax=Nitzschia inconspicua TaxID=303405 RepID=A0A9K3KVM4_9STRA|nr:C2 domain containing protein [Nitzschia inconspicua]
MAKGFANMVGHAVAKEKENSLNASAAAGASDKKQQPNGLLDKAPAIIPQLTKGTAVAASQRKAKADANWDKATNATKAAAVIAKNKRATAGQKLFSRKLVSAMTWEIFSPPPLNSVSGKIVPRVFNRYKNRRLVSIEVHSVTPYLEDTDSKTGNQEAHSYEECVVRVLAPASKELSRKFKREAFVKLRKHEGSAMEYDGSGNAIKDEPYMDDDDDDMSVSDDSMDSVQRAQVADHGGKEYEGWKPKYSFPVTGTTIRLQQKRTVHVLICFQNVKQERDTIFDTIEDAKLFCQEIDRQKRLEKERQQGRLRAALGDIRLPKNEKITLLFEIVSGFDLPIGDYKSSDPFVIAMLGFQEVHRTSHVEKTLNPIWTLKTGSLFLLTVESERFFVEDGMQFIVKDYDQLGKDEVLGLVHVNPRTLYQSKGERMEFKLQPPMGSKHKEVPGFLVLRCRRATEYDIKFMADYAKTKGAKGVASYEHPKANTGLVKTLTTWNRKKEKDGSIKFRVRPGPDPKRLEETEWMTDAALQDEVLKPSLHWTDIGYGELAKVYVEILGADGLPNMDTGAFLGNKTDAFVSLLYEDCTCRTDVIDDCLSPRWLPWSNRAFVLRMNHPSSLLNIAVFDFDAGVIDDHDLIGRVSVNLTNLRKDTEYVLSYNLYPSARIGEREIVGKITIRLRLDIHDERKLVLSSLTPPLPTYVNVKKKRDFKVIRETCYGKYDEEVYSVSTLKSYVEELQSLQYSLFYIEDALMALLLWRGHFGVKVFGKQFKLPIHSFNMFVVSIFLVEFPQLIPSFTFASVAWLLIAVMGWRRNSQNVWTRCYSYAELLRKLALGDSLAPPHNYKPYENFDAAKEEMEKWVNRVEEAQKKAARDLIEAQQVEEERLKEQEDIGEADTDIGTKVGGGISIDPMKAALYPIQLMLGIVCRGIRFVKNVIIWEESYFSFWIATGSLVLAIVCVFVPWFWIMKWTARLVVWSLTGPWMKLVDIFYLSKIKPETEEERQLREQAEKLKRKLATTEAARHAREVREDATKMKVMKKYMFGKFAMRIPILKQDRYADVPLPESWATPYKEKEFSLAELAMQEAGYNCTKVPGQTLVGDMIPYIAGDAFTAAPIGKATAHPEKLAKGVPGANATKATDTTAEAYMKIGAVVVVAVVVSYVGTPMIASSLSQLFH